MSRSKIDIQNADDESGKFDVLVDGDHYARAATKEEAWMFVALAAREVVLIRDLTKGGVLDQIESRNRRIAQKVPRYIVDGHEFPDEESNLMADGEYPPFYVFDVDRQTNVIGHYPTREEAQRIADLFNLYNANN